MLLASTMFLALLMTPAPAEEAIVLDLGNEPAVDDALDFSSTDLQPAPETPEMQPMAICRLRPECDSNADCVAICGTAGAKCVHSRCPVRVCRC
jgi:hypothetical protein